MLASISSGASAGTNVIKCCPDCMTEPTDTLATDCTVASAFGMQFDQFAAQFGLVQKLARVAQFARRFRQFLRHLGAPSLDIGVGLGGHRREVAPGALGGLLSI